MLLRLWTTSGYAIVANPIAFLISAQVNFLLSATFIWGDRNNGMGQPRAFLRRWIAFHGAIFGTALLNQAVFIMAQQVLPALTAAGSGSRRGHSLTSSYRTGSSSPGRIVS